MILAQAERVVGVSDRFLSLWRAAPAATPIPRAFFPPTTTGRRWKRSGAIHARPVRGYAGLRRRENDRRILGLAHVEDLKSIADPERRAQCEAKALRLARELVLGAGGFASLADVTGAARAVESGS